MRRFPVEKGGAAGTKGGGPEGPVWGSKRKVDGAFGPEGCIEGLCPQRGNDSLHFMRRYRSYKMCSLCIAGAQGAIAAPLLRVVDCRFAAINIKSRYGTCICATMAPPSFRAEVLGKH